jgi:heavy metal-binding protein
MALRAVVLLALAGGLFAQKTEEAPPAPVEWTCPMDPEVRAKLPGQCSKCGMKLEPGIKEFVEYPVTLAVSPLAAPAAQPLRLEFRIFDPKSGKPVTAFETVHEKLFHLFLFSADLQHFEHVHPERSADGASFVLEATLPKPGVYRLLTDFYPTGGTPQMTPLTLATSGYDKPLVPAKLAAVLTPQRGENLVVELQMDPPEPIAGKKTLLFFRLKPADGLERYLGAWGHLLAVSDDLLDAIHTHPEIADGGPQAQFNIFFPREAVYRLWVQFQRNGKLNTVAFTVPVSRLK